MSRFPSLPMNRPSSRRSTQTGAFLLEAMIAILIFALGVLGIVGLQGSAMRFTNDAQYRGEAVYLANSLMARMWADDTDPVALAAKYDSGAGGSGYLAFKQMVSTLPGAPANDPVVEVNPATCGNPPVPVVRPSVQGSVVCITVFWEPPGEAVPTVHRFETMGVIGLN